MPAYEEPPPEWLVRNVERWLPLIHYQHSYFPDLDPAWVLAIIAQESQGNPTAIAEDVWGSTGLLQVGPRSWLATREQLLNPSINIRVGMSMLSDILRQTKGDLRLAFAAYNCGFTGVEKDLCGSHGGYAYADRIIDYWLPVFRAGLWTRAGETDDLGMWLRGVGYGEGFGNWFEREVIMDKIMCHSLKTGSACTI